MASRKEYEVLFALNAQLNGGFNSTFSKAQSEFSKLGKEIQSLSKLQSDISSYQKQQTAVGNTTAKLKNLNQQQALLKQQISETAAAGESTAALEREELKLEQQIRNTEAALERQNQRLETTGARLNVAGVNTANLSQKDAELTDRIKELAAEQEKAAKEAVDFGRQSVQAIETVAQAVAAAGIAAGFHEIADAYMECVGIAGDLESTMSNVEALSGASSGEMAELTAKAKELGANTKFTALESADAMGYMAMAGWDAAEMLDGMDGVMQLAAASGEDLANVSDIVTDNLTAFGLTAADTAHFSDVLAMAATRSNTDVGTMGETFKMSASLAGALGYSIEDVAVAVGLMANSGTKGSIAGTALKNTFNGLIEGVTLTGTAFGECQYSAVNADGTMKDFGTTIKDLRGYFEQMTDAEKASNAQAIAGMYGYNGLLSILNATNEDYAALTDNINNCTGAAERMAAIKLDNLNGDIALMDSAVDAFKTTLGEQFIPEMRKVYSVGTDVFGLMDSFVQEHPALVKGIGLFTGLIGTATTGVVGLSAAVKAYKALNIATLFAGPVAPILAGVAGLSALAAGVYAFKTAANEAIPPVSDLASAARDMNEAIADAETAYEDSATQTLATAEAAQVYIDKLDALGEVADASDEHSQTYLNTLSLLVRTFPELADSVDTTTGAISGGIDALRTYTDEWKKNAEAQAYQEYINSLYDEYGEVQLEAAENSIKLTQAQIKLETAEKNRDKTLSRMSELTREANESGGALSQEYYELENSLNSYNDEISETERTIKNLNAAIDEDAEAVAEAEVAIDNATDAINRLTGANEEQSEAAAEVAAQEQQLQTTIEDVTAQVAALTEAYNNAYTAALDSVTGQYSLWDDVGKAVATSTDSINSALESQVAYWDRYNQNLESLRERTADIEGLSDVIASFADGSKESVNAIAGMATASDGDLAAMVENWQTLQEAQSEVSQSIADLKTDFANQMDELQDELAANIESMDLCEEAAESGASTIQGFIDGSNSMMPQVQTAYGRLAQAAVNALNNASGGNFSISFPAFAAGTDNAPPGAALVGEHGPELVLFNGGERVLTASQTTAAIRDNVIPFSPAGSDNAPIQVQIVVNGNADSDTVNALRDQTEEIVERVMEEWKSAQNDTLRRAY